MLKYNEEFNLYDEYLPKYLKTEEFKDLRKIDINYWSSDRFKLKHPEFYSKELLDEFDRIFKAIVSYLGGNSIMIVSRESKISNFVIKRIARDILDRKSMEKILILYVGYKSKLGLDFCVAQINIFYFKYKKVPLSTTKETIAVSRGICQGCWKEFGINSWRDLLIYTFGKKKLEILMKNEKKIELDQAIIMLKDYFERYKKLQYGKDLQLRRIYNYCNRGYWKDFGIENWIDLIVEVFEKEQIDKLKERRITNKRKKKIELDHTIIELKEYFKENKKIPYFSRDSHLNRISHKCKNGYWKEFEIESLRDLFIHTFGKKKIDKLIKNKKKIELDQAISELEGYVKQNKMLVYGRNVQYREILHKCNSGYWKDFGIEDWDDFIKEIK